jgi:thiol-disulfide isomerase/thioredoxin
MNRRHWALGGVAAVAGAAGVGWALWRERPPAAIDATEAFWSRSFEQPAGGTLAASAFRGRPLLLNFWATWCPPCVREMPMLDRFYRAQKAGGLAVAGLAVDSPTPVRDYLRKLPMSFPIGLAGLDGVEVSRALGNRNGGLPFTIVFDARGRVHDRKLGALAEDDLTRWTSQLVSG